ncbi:DUF2782 domain-containing protein [Oleiagrimonas sp. C23AA]|uniref:DUF2782 domain-containing protein n=1 Tax=Oleiagrimonas sp. C23AA TaxID=2719047 RepID=UPI00142228DF|nr:DUF2782 domain-containing protein [Oleiagrimonas sp. C23AA]NII12317.1 DUF2782 domain-containing protein [Oleiagrimonas sp. C23AA]
MKLSYLFIAGVTAALATTPVLAQQDTQPAPPPPGLNDPGVKAKAPPPQHTHTPPPQSARQIQKQSLQPELPAKIKSGQPMPDVKVHNEGDKTVEEYSRNGQVYMVRVTPKHGVPYTYMVGNDGRLHGQNGAPPVTPTMYKVLEWGKPPKPVDDGDQGDGDQ